MAVRIVSDRATVLAFVRRARAGDTAVVGRVAFPGETAGLWHSPARREAIVMQSSLRREVLLTAGFGVAGRIGGARVGHAAQP